MSNAMFELGEISGKAIFIDGIKIESCANTYNILHGELSDPSPLTRQQMNAPTLVKIPARERPSDITLLMSREILIYLFANSKHFIPCTDKDTIYLV